MTVNGVLQNSATDTESRWTGTIGLQAEGAIMEFLQDRAATD